MTGQARIILCCLYHLETISIMGRMTYNSQELVEKFDHLVLSIKGEHTQFTTTSEPKSADQNSLVFLTDATLAPEQAAAIVTTEEIAEQLDPKQSLLICVADPKFAMAMMKQQYDDYLSGDFEWDAFHASAVIHPSAQFGEGCRVGPNAVVGANCVIGDNVFIRATAVIEHNVTIGDKTLINSGVNIGYGSQIGKGCIIQSNAVIANEGFGFAQDENKAYHHVPHTGNVVLEDDVWIGAASCVDRGTYGSTIIKRGVKIDNQCHAAHNMLVEEDGLWVAQTGMSGSSQIGKRVILSGQTGSLDHIKVVDDAVLVHRAGIIHDITSSGVWAGTPAIPFRQYMRNLRTPIRLEKLEKAFKELKAKLDLD